MNTRPKHTLGPWFVQESNYADIGLLVKPIPGKVVAVCVPLDEMAANAMLVAAAPELLDALKYALPYLESVVPNPRDNGTDINCVSRARAAIAKAEGNE